MRPVPSEAVRRSAPSATTNGQSQPRPEGTTGTQPRGQSKRHQGGDEGPFTSAVMEVCYEREVLRDLRYERWMMNSAGQEVWRDNRRTVILEPSGTWSMKATKSGRPLAEGQGRVALEKAIADPSLGLDLRELVRLK